MLLHLSVENYALIRKLEIDFTSGLTVITGETGAGKSILLGALSLILGQRADVQSLLEKEKKCIVEGIFDLSALDTLKPFFDTNELDFEKETTIRREISPQGKSRAFINDTPVTLNILKELGEQLIDIHSQHNTISLNASDFQLEVLDTFLNRQDLFATYEQKYNTWKQLRIRLDLLLEKDAQIKQELDFLQFLYQELEDANLVESELLEIEQNLEIQNHAEAIKSVLYESAYRMDGGELNILGQLTGIFSQLQKMGSVHPELPVYAQRLNSALLELKDLSNEMDTLQDKIHFDPEIQNQLNERLELIQRLFRKHNVDTIESLISKKNNLEEKLTLYSSNEEEIARLGKENEKIFCELIKLANDLTTHRKKAKPELEKQLKEVVSHLGMAGSEIDIEITHNSIPGRYGLDKVRILFSANKGSELRDLSKVASGGELSRLMLAVKSVITKQNILPTVIFDEIDSGVSGDIAGKVGSIMRKMANYMQVIAITHLPQIAASADHHFWVYKQSDDEKTLSNIKQLSNDERIEEIAKMLSSDKVTDTARKAAKELIHQIY
jgi:DNA repair protein RecN (Recombination protein N)